MRKIFCFLLIFCILPMAMFAQTLQVSGKVTGTSDGLPIPGVTVLIQNQKGVGAMTDSDGKFSLKVNKGEILSFSFIGMETESVKVESDQVLNIQMKESSSVLDEVVVVGYGTMRKSDITGATTSIKGEELSVLSTVNLQTALGGRAAGVQVTSSGSVDGNVKVRIRGIGTINNSDPLYVVDGFPTNDISYLAPTDIESMEVLKDASASAIYGSRGANGVILLTTKKGVDQQTRVNVNAFWGVREASKTLDVLNAADYARARIEANENGGTTVDVNTLARLNLAIENNSNGTDWQQEVLRTAVIQNYNISVLGGSDKIKYNLSATYSEEEGVLNNSFVDKLFLRMNTEYKLHEKIRFGSDVSFVDYTMSDTDLSNMYGSALTLAVRAAPVSPVFDQFGNWESTMSIDHNAARVNYMEKYKQKQGNKFVGNFFLNIDILKGLSFKSTFGGDYTFDKYRNYQPAFYVSQLEINTQSQLTESRGSALGWVWSNVATYNIRFNHHQITAMAGTEATFGKYENITATAFDVMEDQDMRFISAAKSNNYVGKSSQSRNTIFSTFFRFNYSYKNRYMLTGTVRRDASSRFSKENRAGTFPSLSLGWNMKEESFLKSIQPISKMRLRAGWGQVGNQSSAGNGEYLSKITNGLKYVLGGQVYEGRTPTVLSNPKLKWEIAEQYNAGLDFGLFNGKIGITADYFIKDTKDMIVRVPIPNYVGAEPPLANVGTMRNTGYEFTFEHSNKISDFSYSASLNLSFVTNKVTSLGRSGAINTTVYDGRLANTSRTEEGREVAFYSGYQTDGVFHTEEELKAHVNSKGEPIQPEAQVGDVKFVDKNGNGRIDEGDLSYLGSYMPDFTGGINLSMKYKNIDFSFFSDFVYGNKIANLTTFDLRSSLMNKNILQSYYDNRWTKETPYNDQPRLTTSASNAENVLFSDRYIEDGSFFRLRNIQIGYTIPQKWTKKVKISFARLYLAVDNLYTFTKYSGYNPEIADQWGQVLTAGSDVGGTPLPRTYSFGINLNF